MEGKPLEKRQEEAKREGKLSRFDPRPLISRSLGAPWTTAFLRFVRANSSSILASVFSDPITGDYGEMI